MNVFHWLDLIYGLLFFTLGGALILVDLTPLPCYESLSILLICFGAIATIHEIVSNKDQKFQIANRYRYKALWYGAVSVSTIFIFIANISDNLNQSLLVFNGILVFIAIHECVDNILSFKVEKKKLKNWEFYGEDYFKKPDRCTKQQPEQPIKDKYKEKENFHPDYEIGVLRSMIIAVSAIIIGIIAFTDKKK